MGKLVAALILVMAAGGVSALERATTLGPQADILVMEGIKARHDIMKTKLEADMQELQKKTDAMVNCGKQQKFYNEGTTQCE